MVKKIRGYLLFTSSVYRIVMFGILPLILAGSYVVFTTVEGDVFILLFMIMVLMVMVEILADNWMFGGIQDREGAKMDFLKTSPKGMKLLENALALDLVRRLVTMSAIMAVGFITNRIRGIRLFGGDVMKEAGVLAGLTLVSYALSVLGTLLTRFFSLIWGNLLVGCAAIFIDSLCCAAVLMTGNLIALDCVFALLAVGATVLAVKAAMGKVRGGYYDR